MMGQCGTTNCKNTVDPRWYIHSQNGSLPACDGCGCSSYYPCTFCKSKDKYPDSPNDSDEMSIVRFTDIEHRFHFGKQ